MRDLLAFALEGGRFGVWKDLIPAMRPVKELHALPLSSSWIAGVTRFDGRTVTLLDVSACIGLPPIRDRSGMTALFSAETGDGLGFAVGGIPEVVQVPPEALVPMPERVSTSLVRDCAILGPETVPVVDLGEVGRLALTSTAGAPAPGLSVSAARGKIHSRDDKPLRILSAGGFLFALPAASVMETGAASSLCALPNVPPALRGICARRGRAVPVADLSLYMAGRPCGETPPLFVIGEENEAIGLLADGDCGTIAAGRWTGMELPPLLRKSETPAVAAAADRLAFLLETPEMFGTGSGLPGPAEAYAPDSDFAAGFLRGEVRIVEIRFCGKAHAVPASETEDIVAFKPIHGAPMSSGIVRGAAVVDGAILPVLDLAAVYGRRTETDPARAMVLIRNGNFRALVLNEGDAARRTLGKDAQRPLPVTPPHDVVYGCYTESNEVRLILNVEALAVHFEESEVAEFFAGLPAEIAGFGPLPAGARIPEEQATAAGAPRTEPEPAAAPAPVIEPQPMVEPEPAPGVEPAAAQELIVDAAAAPETAIGDELELDEDALAVPIDDQAAVQMPELELDTEAAPAPEPEPIVETAPMEVPEPAPTPEPEPIMAAEPVPEPAPETIAEAAPAIAPEPEPTVFEAPELAPEETLSVQTIVEEPSPSRTIAREPPPPPARHGKSRLLMAAVIGIPILIVCAVLAFLALRQMGTGGERPVVTETAPVAEKPPELELDVPAEVPVEIDVYTVVKGDTLWDISERFTGSPWNFPRIAGENTIANPDLIFPGQRIRLIKKK